MLLGPEEDAMPTLFSSDALLSPPWRESTSKSASIPNFTSYSALFAKIENVDQSKPAEAAAEGLERR